MDLTINYNEQMLNYYPEIIKAIREFQAMMETESIEVEELHQKLVELLGDAYISTASESRISQWEKLLNITPLDQGEDSLETWLSDRRETILARVYTSSKLNSQAITDIVKIFTGGTANSWFKNGTIYIEITPPPDNKQFKFENVEQELKHKVPAHLGFQVSRNYYTWGETQNRCTTWQDVLSNFETWNNVLLYVPFE